MRFKRNWLPVILILVICGLFFSPVLRRGWLPYPGDLLVSYYAPWSRGTPHKAQGIDVVRQVIPWKNLSISQFKNWQIPFWNPYNLSGTPLLANFQTGNFYPLNLLFLIFNFSIAWIIYIFLQPFLAFGFTYLYLRSLKASRWASIFSGLAFSFCLYLTVWLEWGNVGHAFIWLPAVLFLVDRWAEKQTVKNFLLLVFCLSASILAGYAQITIYLLSIFLVYSWYQKQKRLWLAALFSFGMTAFQILPTLELFINSARQAYLSDRIKELLLPPIYLVTSFVSDFFGNPASRNYWFGGTYIERVSYFGIIPLFLTISAIIWRRKENLVRFWSVIGGLALFFSLNLPPVRFFYGLKIPLVSTFVYTRLLGIFSFSGAILAGFGLDHVLKTKATGKTLKASLFFAGIYGIFWLVVLLASKIWPSSWWINNLPITRRNLILPTLFSLAGAGLLGLNWCLPRLKSIVLAGLVAVTIFDLWFYFQKITPFSSKELMYPSTEVITALRERMGYSRFWGYGNGYIDTNFATQLGLYSTDGYDPLFIRRYGELISASADGKIQKSIPRSDVNLTRGFGKDALKQNPYRQRLLNLLGVKYVLDKNGDSQTFSREDYELVWGKEPWMIYENKKVLPRAFLVGEYEVVTDRQKIVDQLMSPKFDMSKKIILEESLSEDVTLGDQGQSQVKIADYRPNKVTISTQSPNTGLLFLSDNDYPGWQASIDEKPSKIYRADYSFRTVVVPAGDHQVVFSYRPKSFTLGLFLSLITVIGVTFICLKKEILILG